MSGQRPNLRSKILILAVVTMILMFLGLVYTLYLSWGSILRSTEGELKREACTTSSLVRGSLIDASKVLDMARRSLDSSLRDGPLDPKKAHEILRSAVENFSMYNTADSFGLLLYLDAGGQLVARSGEYPSAPIDLSDRYYYRSLRDDPSRKFSIGRLRNAATTGRMVFHLAMPVHGSNGSFSGVVTIQIEELELANLLQQMLNGLNSRIIVRGPGGVTIFLFPAPKRAPSLDDPSGLPLQCLASSSQPSRGSMRIPAGIGTFQKRVYAGFDGDAFFGFSTWAIVPESLLWTVFINQNRNLILFAGLGVVIIASLVLGLYRQGGRLESALKAANLDDMTLISNRRAFEAESGRLWRDSLREGRPISVLFMDIDYFKDFNDRHGHTAGDRVLKAVARVILRSIERPLDLCYRWGGEEFVVILPQTESEGALVVAHRIRERVRCMKLKFKGVLLPRITVSTGIATTRRKGADTMEDLIIEADSAMRRAKAEGRDRTVLSGIDPPQGI
jgi:diguanylate cyclase (GGDEF)-like protein